MLSWLNPAKDLLNSIFNSILSPYVENLDMNQVSYGVGQGSLTLRNLKLKRSALDKFRLPVDVLEGHLGLFTLNFHWTNLGNQPVQILIEDLYLLVAPAAASKYDPNEDEARQQASKQERLKSADLLQLRGQAEANQDDAAQSQGFLRSLTTKILNNFQLEIRRIHVRYEDAMSCPGHPFAAGLTLNGFNAISTNGKWEPAFIESTAGAVHKLAKLDSLALYFDTDAESLQGLSRSDLVEHFEALISQTGHLAEHQYLLKPISGEGRIILNHKLDKQTPRIDTQLLFDEISFAVDAHQYRDVISMVDMYHFYLRHNQYRKFKPTAKAIEENKARVMLKFAGETILREVQDKNRRWTWEFFANRRDDRRRYVELFTYKETTPPPQNQGKMQELDALEQKLSYEDIRFYRSIARAAIQKDKGTRQKAQELRVRQAREATKENKGWVAWAWGSNTPNQGAAPNAAEGPAQITEQQRQEFYADMGYDEKEALAASFAPAEDAIKMRIAAKLNKGSLTLKARSHREAPAIISFVFDSSRATFLQRPDSFDATLALGGLRVHDGTCPGTMYPQIVRIKPDSSRAPSPAPAVVEMDASADMTVLAEEPFLFVQIEQNPLDQRANTALTVQLKAMEVVYHRGYVEAIYKFFQPPESQLESIAALMDVASETLEGFRNQTRAGLEHALQTHKTIDLKMDLHAPIIIVPEDVKSKEGVHLVVDAGHISVGSKLVDQTSIRQVRSKRDKQYTAEDFQQLESLMYDQFTLKLESAQVLLGENLDALMAALSASDSRGANLLERTSFDLSIQNSILPSAFTLPRIKVSGTLPTLQVNLSNTKYKGIMRLIDVAIPKLGKDSTPKRPTLAHVQSEAVTSGFRLPSNLFTSIATEYVVDEGSDDDDDTRHDDDEFFETEDHTSSSLENQQHQFVFDFSVQKLQASLFKSMNDGPDKAIADVVFDTFNLGFVLRKYDMSVDVTLRSLSMGVVTKNETTHLMSTDSTTGKNLMTVKYTRVQKESPDFMTTYEGVGQSVDVNLSTVMLRAEPEPVISLYDFIMSTFVPEPPAVAPSLPSTPESPVAPPPSVEDNSKIRVRVHLESIQVGLANAGELLATLSFSTGDVTILLRNNTMRLGVRLGSLALVDESLHTVNLTQAKEILSIEGDNFADLSYETFNPRDPSFSGINSLVTLRAGSLRFHYLEQPVSNIYHFMLKLARLKGLYDTAAQAAVLSASEIQRMKFDVLVKSPILIFPHDAVGSQDVLVVKLGEITAQNSYESDTVTKTTAKLSGIRLTSEMYYDGEIANLKIIEDVEITTNLVQTSRIDHSAEPNHPDLQIGVEMSDIKLALTQRQYVLLMSLAQSIPRAFSGPSDLDSPVLLSGVVAPSTLTPVPEPSPSRVTESTPVPAVDMGPELGHVVVAENGSKVEQWTTIDFSLAVSAVKLHLYDRNAKKESDLKETGIARFALSDNAVRYKMLSDGSSEVEVVLKSFTVGNTRPGSTKFREIIPAAQHDRNQFMVLLTISGGTDRSMLAIVTIDSPKVLFTLDPVFALADFFTMPALVEPGDDLPVSDTPGPASEVPKTSPSLDFRVDLHDISISLLESDTDVNTQAIRLAIKQISMSQQGILAMNISRLGMSLTRMGQNSESVRFLDDIDVTFAMDSRQSVAQQMTNIDIECDKIVFRASHRDINLITAIVNKAIQLSSKTNASGARPVAARSNSLRPSSAGKTKPIGSRAAQTARLLSTDQPRLVISQEKLHSVFGGFQLVLIGDLHELPMLDVQATKFEVIAQDWTGDLHASMTIDVNIAYWNLTNSHWEPFIDPWRFTIVAARDIQTGGMSATISSATRLDINLTSTFIELVMTAISFWSQEGARLEQKARGSYAPYKIQNRTGDSLTIWSDGSSQKGKDPITVQLANDETIDWRFDDWQILREGTSTDTSGNRGQNTIGVQFQGKAWERLRSIPVDRQGELTYALRPRIDQISHRMLCEVTVKDNVKIVTLRSTYKVENRTLYPIEVILVDSHNKPAYAVQKIAPGQDYSLPIEAVTKNRIKLRPDAGFGYSWSAETLNWEDLLNKPAQTITCRYQDTSEAPFRLQAWAQYDATDVNSRKYPKMTLRLRAPIEVENLLPYDIKYRIFDKNTNQNWSSFLRKGGLMPVHSVQLSHLVLLSVQLEDAVYQTSDFSIINTDSPDFEIEKKISLPDMQNRKLDLRLHYSVYPESGGAFKVQVYSPFIFLNKTGLPFGVRTLRSTRAVSPRDIAGEMRPEELSKPIPFMVSHPHDSGNEFIVKIGNSSWSKVLNVEAPNAETDVILPLGTANTEVHVGLSWAEGLGKYKLTKVLTLTPRFLLKNRLDEAVYFREHGVPPQNLTALQPGERASIYSLRSSQDKLMTLAYAGLNAQWTPPINIEDIGTVHLQLAMPGDPSPSVDLIRADVQIEGATIFIILSKEKAGWPFVIENNSDYPFTFAQANDEFPGFDSKARLYQVEPHSSMKYAWDYPAAKDKKVRLTINGQHRFLDIMEMGALPPFKFPGPSGHARTVSIDVRAEGPSQVLEVSNYQEEFSIYKPKRRATGTFSRQDSLPTSVDAFEAVEEQVVATISVNIDLEGVGISLINRVMTEVVYLSSKGLKLEYTNSEVAQAVTLTCGTLQIDNQLHEGLYPVVLQPTPIERDGAAELPVIQASVIVLNDQAHGVLFVKYASILLQAMTVQLDEDFLYAVYDMSKLGGGAWEAEKESILLEHPVDIPEPTGIRGGQDLYFEVLELHPIQLSISFMRTERVSIDEKLSTHNPLAVILNAFTMAVGNINDAPLRMNLLAVKDMRLTVPVLQQRIIYHYRQEVIRQLYRVLGSADFFGNPVGLFTNVSSGVADIFYEPYQGVVMHGNRELGIGIAKGAASFVKKTVFGVTDSMTKVTSSIGKGLSAATFDAEYQNRRRLAQRRNKPRHAIYGVTSGIEALGTSLASGVEGVLLKPIEGAESEGALGFFKGIGRGLVGVVTKPAIGVFDLAANVTEGIRNTTTVFDNPKRDRQRYPRHIPPDGILKPYLAKEAIGQAWMRDLEQGKYRREVYCYHYEVHGDYVALLTNVRVIAFWAIKLRLHWDMPFREVAGISDESTGISFRHKAGKEHHQFIAVPDNVARSTFFSEIEKAVKAYNAEKRIER